MFQMHVPLQSLRVPKGWTIEYNALREIAPDSSLLNDNNRGLFFSQDLPQVTHSLRKRQILVDVGWAPDGDLIEGAYKMYVYEGDCRGRLLHEFRTRSRMELVVELERLLEAGTNGKL